MNTILKILTTERLWALQAELDETEETPASIRREQAVLTELYARGEI